MFFFMRNHFAQCCAIYYRLFLRLADKNKFENLHIRKQTYSSNYTERIKINSFFIVPFPTKCNKLKALTPIKHNSGQIHTKK